jgi:hypothetical protein
MLGPFQDAEDLVLTLFHRPGLFASSGLPATL